MAYHFKAEKSCLRASSFTTATTCYLNLATTASSEYIGCAILLQFMFYLTKSLISGINLRSTKRKMFLSIVWWLDEAVLSLMWMPICSHSAFLPPRLIVKKLSGTMLSAERMLKQYKARSSSSRDSYTTLHPNFLSRNSLEESCQRVRQKRCYGSLRSNSTSSLSCRGVSPSPSPSFSICCRIAMNWLGFPPPYPSLSRMIIIQQYVIRRRRSWHCMGAEVLFAWSGGAAGLLGDQVMLGCTIEDTGSTAFVIGQLVSALGVQVLHVDGVAARAYFYGGSACDLRETGPWRYLAIGIIAEFRVYVVDIAAHLFQFVRTRARVLYGQKCAFQRCLSEVSGSRTRREEPRGSNWERLQSQLPGPGMKACILVSFRGPPSYISFMGARIPLCLSRS